MHQQRVSICIPCYNKPDYVNRCLESIRIQTYKNIEVILSDDSNNNEIESLLIKYPDLNIQYLHNNIPLKSPRNWNHALDAASGDLIMLLHQDDWLAEPHTIEVFVQNLSKHDIDFAFCKNIGIDEDGNKIYFQNEEKIPDLSDFPDYLVIRCVIGPPSNVMFRQKIKIRYDENLIWLVDVDYYIRLLKSGCKYQYINKHLVNIGIHPDQTTEFVRANRSIALKENLFVANRIGRYPLYHINLYDYYWRLIRNYNIRSYGQLELLEIVNKEMEKVFSIMVKSQTKVPQKLLKNGFISKTVMFLTYLRWRLAN